MRLFTYYILHTFKNSLRTCLKSIHKTKSVVE